MAITFRTITGDLAQLLGVDFDRPPKVFVRTNLDPGDAVVDKVGNRVLLGTGRADVASDGTFSVSGLLDAATLPADANPTGVQYEIVVEYTDPQTGTLRSWASGMFAPTANTTLAAVSKLTYLPPSYASDFLAQLASIRAEIVADGATASNTVATAGSTQVDRVTSAGTIQVAAAAAQANTATTQANRAKTEADRARDISNIAVPADVIRSVDGDPASAFRVQSDARQSAAIDAANNELLAPITAPTATPCVVTVTNDVSTTQVPNARTAATGFFTTYPPTDEARFTYLGSKPNFNAGATFPDSRSAFFNYVTGTSDALFSVAPFTVESRHSGTYVEYQVKQLTGAAYWLWVDGKPLTLLPQLVGGTSGGTASIVAFFGGGVHRVQLRAAGTRFYGATCDVSSRIVATPRVGPRVALVGDSYLGGAIIGPLSTPGGLLGQLLQTDDVWNLSVGGRGYLNPGQDAKARDRIAQVTSLAPDLVVVLLGHNDQPYSSATLTTEVNTYISALRTALPAAQIIVTGPLTQGASTAAYVPVQKAIFDGLVGIPRIQTVDTITRNPFTGTGYSASPQGDGNSDLFIGFDNVHPTQDGSFFLTGWLARVLRPLILVSRSQVVAPVVLRSGVPFSDPFTRADSATLGPEWTALLGTWSVVNNTAACTAGTGQNFVVRDTETPDIDLSVTIAGSSALDQGVGFRVVDATNGMMLAFSSSGAVKVFKQVAGIYTAIGTAAVTPVTGDIMRLVTKGGLITVYRNGTSIISVTDASYSTATRHGFWGFGAAPATTRAWDNLTMIAAA